MHKTPRFQFYLFFDAEKAFDMVHWKFLMIILQKMGFGLSFTAWIKQIYKVQGSEIILEGYKSKKFSLHRSVR